MPENPANSMHATRAPTATPSLSQCFNRWLKGKVVALLTAASQLLTALPAPVAGSLPCLHSPLTFPIVKLLHQLLLNVVILSDQGPELCDQGRPGPDVGRAPGPL